MTEHTELARRALEDVCSGRSNAVGDFYSSEFVDHVNAMEFRGEQGLRQSLELYDTLFDDRRFVVEEQVTENGRIVEDWGATDSLELVRQLGIWRTLLLLARNPRLLRH